jgi:hypothetical protein
MVFNNPLFAFKSHVVFILACILFACLVLDFLWKGIKLVAKLFSIPAYALQLVGINVQSSWLWCFGILLAVMAWNLAE